MAKINNLFSRLTRVQFDAQVGGDGFEKHCIVFITDEKKIWNNGVEYGVKDGEVEEIVKTLIVNDLTTGGADKALSAEQGKVLKGLIDAITADITGVKEYTVNGHKISENPVLDKTDIGLSNVTDDAQVKRSEMGVANGVATLGEDGKVPSTQLPSYVDDVIEFQQTYANKAAIPTEGLTPDALYYAIEEKLMFKATSDTELDAGTKPESGKIYIAVAEGDDYLKQYRWGGDSAGLVQITSGNLVLGETAGTAYEGSKGKANADLLASLGAKLITSVDAPTADADKVTFNYKAISKSDANFSAEAPATTDIPAATQSAAGVMKAIDKKNLDILVTIMGGTPDDPESPVNPDTADFLKKSDAGIGVLKDYATAGEPAAVAAGDTIAVAFGKIVKALDTITGGTDGSIPEEGSKVDNYTVNGYKISTNPVLNGGDIALTGFSETPDAEPVNENNIKATDTVNAALKKAQNRVEALEALLEWYEGE